jgi:hypothetical protein
MIPLKWKAKIMTMTTKKIVSIPTETYFNNASSPAQITMRRKKMRMMTDTGRILKTQRSGL